jgi:hypothetical protein
MNYMVKRGEESFGPYNLGELQRYFQEGRVLPGDLAQSEGMSEWVPVSQILGNIPLPAVAPAAAYSGAPAQALVPLPPNLHWAILLILNILSRQFFNWIWAFVQANWARKLSGDNKALVLVAMYPAGFLAAMVCGVAGVGFGMPKEAVGGLAVLFVLGGLIAYIFGIFKVRDAMEDYYNSRENIALKLSGVMTFFFSTVYLQYHINSIARWKKTGVYS